jgi:hypothetical protein
MVIPQPNEYITDNEQWWFVYNSDTLTLLMIPQQCSGRTSSPHIMVVMDTLEECNDYISENELKNPPEKDFVAI